MARIEAEPTAVREFLRQYDAFALTGDVSLRSDPLLAQTARAALLFLDQMVQVRPLLAPFAEVGAIRSVPEFVLGVGMALQADSLPTDEIELQIGARHVTIAETAREQRWRSGDSVTVVLTPFDTAKAREVFAAGGAWSAFRLAQRPPENLTVKLFHPDTKMELKLPYFPITAPDILIPSAALTSAGRVARPRTKSVGVVSLKASATRL